MPSSRTCPGAPSRAGDRQHDRGHGREEHRTLKAATVAAGLAFPHAAQAIASPAGPVPGRQEVADHHRLRDHQPDRHPGQPRRSRRLDSRPLADRSPAPHPRCHLPRGRLPGPHRQRPPGHGHPAQPRHRDHGRWPAISTSPPPPATTPATPPAPWPPSESARHERNGHYVTLPRPWSRSSAMPCLRPKGDPAHIAVVDSEKSRVEGRGGSGSGSDLLVILDDLAPGGGIRFACFGHTLAGFCSDLVVRHRASAPVAASRRLATA